MKVSDIMQKNVIKVSEDTSISKAISIMEKYDFKEIPVTRNNKMVGEISFYDIMEKVRIHKNEKVGKLVKKSPTISPQESVEKAAELMKNSGTEFLVVGKKQIKGVLSDYDIVKAMKQFFKGIPINQVMRTNIPVLPPNSSISQAKKLMEENRIDRLPVVNKRGYMGQVTWADVIRSMANMQKPEMIVGEKIDSTKKPVSDIMRPGEKMLLGNELDKAIELMTEKQIRGVPVVNMENRVEGIIVRRDLLNLLVPDKEGIDVEISGKLSNEKKLVMQEAIKRKLGKFDSINKVRVRIKEIHGGNKHEISLFIPKKGKNISIKKDGFLKPCFDDALSDAERMLSDQ